MCYRYYFLLDLRFIKTAGEIEQICEISDVMFLLYDVNLPEELLSLLRQKSRRVPCFLPLSKEIDLSYVWRSFRAM